MAASSSRSEKRKYPENSTPPPKKMVDYAPKLLKDWWDKLTSVHREIIKTRMGDMSPLLDQSFTPRRDLVNALIHYWEPSQNTFRFNGFEMTPTLEEIAGLLKLEFRPDRKIIAPTTVNREQFCDSLMLRHDTPFVIEGGSCVPLEFLYERFGRDDGYFAYEHEFDHKKSATNWRVHRSNAFVLAFLGTMVFPRSDEHVSVNLSWVTSCLFGALKSSTTIVPMILGSIYQALTHCKENKNRFFEGCNLLLQVWFIEHLLKPSDHPSLLEVPRCHLNLHRVRIQGYNFPDSYDEWNQFLLDLTSEHICWQVSWFPTGKVVCGGRDRPFIVLMGHKGAEPYCPARVLRQLGRVQDVPRVEDLSVYSYKHVQGEFPRRYEWFRLWESLVVEPQNIQIADRYSGRCTPEYIFWYSRQTIPRVMPARRSKATVDETARADIQIEMHKDQLEKEYVATIHRLRAERNAARAAQRESEELAHQHLDTVRRLRELHLKALREKDDIVDFARAQGQRMIMADRIIDRGSQQVTDLVQYLEKMCITHEKSSYSQIGREAQFYARGTHDHLARLYDTLREPLPAVGVQPMPNAEHQPES